ncbi:MAG: S53 family peptidase [Actinomycetota bacterium]|nr:S53 family peptidase [Actinomycetota bacterium]
MQHPTVSLRRVLATAVVLAGTATGLLVPARADTPPQPDPAAVITFLVGLPYDMTALEAAAVAVSSPGSPNFRSYLTPAQAATRYGASASARERVRTAAAKLGLVARIDATGLFARVSGTVNQWEKALGQSVQFQPAVAGSAQGAGPGPFDEYAFASPDDSFAALPKALAETATWFLPFFMKYQPALDVPGVAPASPSTRVLLDEGPAAPLPTNGGTPVGASCVPAAVAPSVFTPGQLSLAYGLRGLQRGVANGVQPRIAVLSLGGGFAQADVDAAAACFGHRAPRVDVRRGLGIGTPIVSLSTESALDLQTVSWAARGLASVRFVQVANGPTGFIEAYAIALTAWPTPPDAITNSFGQCELEPSPQELDGVAPLLQFAALVGTSSFVASGDTGSSSCQQVTGAEAIPLPTVQYPGSEPFVTAVGGTQLNLGPDNTRIGESVWNDLQYGLIGNAVGTGGPSAVFDAPWYQRPLTRADVRMVPDIAAQAGAGPGTAIYVGGQLIGPVGGTSQASPLVATGFAAMSARLREAGSPPLGFVNPWLYRVARFHDDALYDVTVGDNQYPVLVPPATLNVPACCQAQPGYDAASGLGAPLFDQLMPLVDR